RIAVVVGLLDQLVTDPVDPLELLGVVVVAVLLDRLLCRFDALSEEIRLFGLAGRGRLGGEPRRRQEGRDQERGEPPARDPRRPGRGAEGERRIHGRSLLPAAIAGRGWRLGVEVRSCTEDAWPWGRGSARAAGGGAKGRAPRRARGGRRRPLGAAGRSGGPVALW